MIEGFLNSRNNQKSYKSEINIVNMGFVNSYIITGQEYLILVDTGLPGNTKRIIKKIKDMGYKPRKVSLIILTHAHFDHYGSIKELKDITGAKIAIHENDSQYLIKGESAKVTPISAMGRFIMLMAKNSSKKKRQGVQPDILIGDEMDLNKFGVKGKVVSTPGHTEGSISIFLASGECIVGDMLGTSFGRLNYGSFCNNMNMLEESIIKIKYSNVKKVYLSHGGVCSIDKIRKTF